MKKVLLATTVLTSAVVLAAAPASAEVGVSMFSVFTASAGDSDNGTSADRTGHDFATNTELKFTGSTKMDNGITVGFEVQVEADAIENANGSAGGAGDTDENKIYFKGNFGEVILGNEDGAADAGKISGSSVGVNYGGIGNPTGTVLGSLRGAGGANANTTGVWLRSDGGDDTKITYFTPRISGFKAGVSYTPEGSTYIEGWGGHVSYSGEFSGVGVAAVVNGSTARRSGAQQSHIDATGWMFGAKLTYMGFKVAGGYASNDDVGRDKDTANAAGLVGTDDSVFSVGVGYSSGPVSVALAGMWAEEDVSNDDLTEYSISLTYSLGSGVSVFASGIIGESDLNTVGGGGDTDYSMVTVGTAIGF